MNYTPVINQMYFTEVINGSMIAECERVNACKCGTCTGISSLSVTAPGREWFGCISIFLTGEELVENSPCPAGSCRASEVCMMTP